MHKLFQKYAFLGLISAVPVSLYFSYINIYLQDSLNFNPSQVGMFLAIYNAIGIFSLSFWTKIADKHNSIKYPMKIILSITIIVSFIVFFLNGNVKPIITLLLFLSLFISTTITFFENWVLLSHRKLTLFYADIRIYFSLAWAISVLIFGFVIREFGSNYLFLAVALGSIGNLIYLRFMPDVAKENKDESVVKVSKMVLLKNKEYVFVICIFLLFKFLNVLFGFTNYIVEETAFNVSSMTGILIFFNAFLEIPGFKMMRKAMQKYSDRTLLMVSAVLYIIRFITLAFAPWDIKIFIIPITQMICFPITMVVIFKVITNCVEPSIKNQALGVAQIGQVIISIVASFLYGRIINNFGISYIYYFSIVVAIILLPLIMRYGKKRTI